MRYTSTVLIFLFGSALSATTELRSKTGNKCAEGSDPIGCLQSKTMDILERAISTDRVEIMDGVKLVKTKEISKREERGIVEGVEELLDTHDIEIEVAGSKLTVSPSNADGVSFKIGSGSEVEGKGRKSRLRKLLIPLMVFVLLKAMTLIPLALGVLGLKAWNALQLSFFSFVTSLALAIFNLCKKVASDSSVPVAHTFAADPYHLAARNLILPQSEDAQELAFSAYAGQK